MASLATAKAVSVEEHFAATAWATDGIIGLRRLYKAILRALALAASNAVNIFISLSLMFWCSRIGFPP